MGLLKRSIIIGTTKRKKELDKNGAQRTHKGQAGAQNCSPRQARIKEHGKRNK